MYKNKSRRPLAVKRRRTIRKRKVASKLSVGKALKAYIKKSIRGNMELKHATPLMQSNIPIRPYGITPNGPHQLTTLNLNGIFTIPVGTQDGERIGDKIRVKSFNIKGFLNLDSTKADDATFKKNPMLVKMFVGRRVDTTADPSTYGPTAYENLFATGPTTTPPSNQPHDMFRYINKDVYRIYAVRTFKIGVSSPSNTPSDSAQYNNDFSFSRQFSINLSKHVHDVKYTQGGNTPQNVAFYVWFVCAFANGSAPNVLDNNMPLEWHYDVNCTYYDA